MPLLRQAVHQGMKENVFMALDTLRNNKLRSALTTLGIIIGVAAVIVVVSLVQGLKTSVLKQVERAGSTTSSSPRERRSASFTASSSEA